jgi:dihydroxyacetone kinase-like protein
VSELADVLEAVARFVGSSADELNRLDAVAGDGDLGVTAQKASTGVLEVLSANRNESPERLVHECGLKVASVAPSTSGTLIGSALMHASTALDPSTSDNSALQLARALGAARASVAERGKAELGSKTMLDALSPAADAAQFSADSGAPLGSVVAAAAHAADAGATATASMTPRHGRASWLAERAAGNEDAGARLIAIILSAAHSSLTRSEEVKP